MVHKYFLHPFLPNRCSQENGHESPLRYQVTAKTSSVVVLKAMQQEPEAYDLIITDQTMPHLSGSQLARQIFKIRPDIPIILCTGFSSILTEEEAKGIGIREFVMKPFNMRDLAIIIRRVLDEKPSRQNE